MRHWRNARLGGVLLSGNVVDPSITGTIPYLLRNWGSVKLIKSGFWLRLPWSNLVLENPATYAFFVGILPCHLRLLQGHSREKVNASPIKWQNIVVQVFSIFVAPSMKIILIWDVPNSVPTITCGFAVKYIRAHSQYIERFVFHADMTCGTIHSRVVWMQLIARDTFCCTTLQPGQPKTLFLLVSRKCISCN
jgi:hypothetical protein